jgi:hypothetical protein
LKLLKKNRYRSRRHCLQDINETFQSMTEN